jgi:hypothetical protein
MLSIGPHEDYGHRIAELENNIHVKANYSEAFQCYRFTVLKNAMNYKCGYELIIYLLC